MKNLSVLFLITITLFNCENESVITESEEVACDDGTFVGTIWLRTQQEVNDFGALCYSKIEGTLAIGFPGASDNDIIDLSPLNSLVEILNGRIRIHAGNLPNLNGLHKLEIIGGLLISECNSLTDLTGLESLTTVGNIEPNAPAYAEQLAIVYNESLLSLNGLDALTNVNGIIVQANIKLQSLDGLETLTTVTTPTHFSPYGWPNTVQIGGLPGIGFITTNPELADLCALQNLFVNGAYDPDKVLISLNAFNPTIQDIKDGNCSQ